MPKDENNGIRYYIRLTVICLLAFAAGFSLLPVCGVWACLPFCTVCAAVAAFLKYNKWLKAALFALMAYILSAFYGVGAERAITAACFAAAVLLICELGVFLFRKKSGLLSAAGIALAVLTLIPHFALFGDPISGFSADKALSDYGETRFDSASVVCSRTYFDSSARVFKADVYGANDVTGVCVLEYRGGRIVDTYSEHAELSLMTDARLTLQLALRERFPNGSFNVVRRAISGYPDGKIDVSAQRSDIKNMYFDVNITTALAKDDFAALCAEYASVLAALPEPPAEAVFYGGSGGEMYHCVRILLTKLPAPARVSYCPSDPFTTYTVSLIPDYPA